MGGITSTFNLSIGSGLSGNGTVASPLTIAAPSYGSVGSYVWGAVRQNANTNRSYTAGQTFSAGAGDAQLQSYSAFSALKTNNLSGTWAYMAGPQSNYGTACCAAFPIGLFVRVS